MLDTNLGSELDGGTFGLTFPSGWAQWLGFVIGFLISLAGIATFFLAETDTLPALISVGALIMGFSTPTKLQKTLRGLRSQLNPAQVNWQKEQGGTELQSFWNSATINKPTIKMISLARLTTSSVEKLNLFTKSILLNSFNIGSDSVHIFKFGSYSLATPSTTTIVF